MARHVAPWLRKVPRRWGDKSGFPSEESFDNETRRIGSPSWQRHGHPNIRFRTERELREFLGPAGPEREWHHIVEKRLAENGQFPVEIIHNTDNIISLPVEVHRRVSAKMSSRSEEFGNEVRRLGVEKMPFGDQYNYGLELIRETLEELGYDPYRF